MTQQQRENWLQQLRNKMNALDPGMVFVINKKPSGYDKYFTTKVQLSIIKSHFLYLSVEQTNEN